MVANLSMFRFCSCFLLGLLLFIAVAFATNRAEGQDEKCVAISLPSIGSLVEQMLAGVCEPIVLLSVKQDPHSGTISPNKQQQAFLAPAVIYLHPEFEIGMYPAIEKIAEKSTAIEIATLLKLDEEHDEHKKHDEHDEHKEHDKHDEHKEHAEHDEHAKHAEHKEHDEHDEHAEHAEHAKHAEHKEHEEHDEHDEHAEHDAHHHSDVDYHIWLNPRLMLQMVRKLQAPLTSLYPAHAELIEKNSIEIFANLLTADHLLARALSANKDKPFMVVHDAYAQLEKRFGLNKVAVLNRGYTPHISIKHLSELSTILDKEQVRCAIVDPNYSTQTLRKLIGTRDIKVVEIDPVGSEFFGRPDGYFLLLEDITEKLSECLAH